MPTAARASDPWVPVEAAGTGSGCPVTARMEGRSSGHRAGQMRWTGPARPAHGNGPGWRWRSSVRWTTRGGAQPSRTLPRVPTAQPPKPDRAAVGVQMPSHCVVRSARNRMPWLGSIEQAALAVGQGTAVSAWRVVMPSSAQPSHTPRPRAPAGEALPAACLPARRARVLTLRLHLPASAGQLISSRTAAKAAAADSSSARSCAADSCVLMRALPTGTTG